MTTAVEEGTLGYTDREHVELAYESEWLLLTFDDDFLSLVESEFEDEHPTVVYASQHGRDVGTLVRELDSALEHRGSIDVSGEIIYV